MFVRRSPAVLLSLVLGAAALVGAPSALASDGGPAKDFNACSDSSFVRLKVVFGGDGNFDVIASVYANDEDLWAWKLKHNGDYSASGEARAKDADRSFKVDRIMVDLPGPDDVSFRAVNIRSGEVCKGEVTL